MAYPDLQLIVEFESRGRRSHIHWDGAEVQREFYCRPFRAAPQACAALVGYVERTGQSYTRRLPAIDPYYNQICYCNEARWEHVDGGKGSIAYSQGVAAQTPDFDPIPADTYNHFMAQVNTVPELSAILPANPTEADVQRVQDELAHGAFITASYRPLISAYTGLYGVPDRDRQFDWMNPLIVPGLRTIPWPDGLFIKQHPTGNRPVPTEVSEPIPIPIKELTIRRLLLGKVPYTYFDLFLGKVNFAAWPTGDYGEESWAYTIPQFPAETVKFESYEVIPHWSQLSERNLWYEVVFHFSIISLHDVRVNDADGQQQSGRKPVTWNHALFRPAILRVIPTAAKVEWWYVHRNDGITINIGEEGGPLYGKIPFDGLFTPVTPGME